MHNALAQTTSERTHAHLNCNNKEKQQLQVKNLFLICIFTVHSQYTSIAKIKIDCNVKIKLLCKIVQIKWHAEFGLFFSIHFILCIEIAFVPNRNSI